MKKTTRIQAENTERVIQAALTVFAKNGFKGTTVDQIASESGMSKANVLYYFRRKQDIYVAVLEHTLTNWLTPLEALDPNGDPLDELWQYAKAKLSMSRTSPEASRLFANEILSGAPMIKSYLENDLRKLVQSKCETIQGWIDNGQLTAVEPLHLIFFIWSATQHYADFMPQVAALHTGSEDELFTDAEQTLWLLLRNGLVPE